MKRGIFVAVLLLAVSGAHAARAQELVDIEVVAAGMSLAGIEVYVFALGEAFLVGETDASGVVSAPPDLVGLSPGDRLEVHQIVCADGRAVLLVPRDESPEDECRRRRTEDPTCACGSVGEVRWSERVAIDLVSEEPPVAADEPDYDARDYGDDGTGLRWVVGAGAGWSSWPNLDKACAAEPAARTCELEAQGPTFRAAVEARRPGFPISLMGAVGYTTGLEVDQSFDPTTNPLDPRRNVIELDVVTFEGYGVGRFSTSPSVEAFVALGYVWAHDRITATTTFGSTTGTDERTASGGRFGARAGADWWPADRGWGLRLEAGGMSGDEENIDASWSVGAMILFAVGGR